VKKWLTVGGKNFHVHGQPFFFRRTLTQADGSDF
jgi:hypothetical protein